MFLFIEWAPSHPLAGPPALPPPQSGPEWGGPGWAGKAGQVLFDLLIWMSSIQGSTTIYVGHKKNSKSIAIPKTLQIFDTWKFYVDEIFRTYACSSLWRGHPYLTGQKFSTRPLSSVGYLLAPSDTFFFADHLLSSPLLRSLTPLAWFAYAGLVFCPFQ